MASFSTRKGEIDDDLHSAPLFVGMGERSTEHSMTLPQHSLSVSVSYPLEISRSRLALIRFTAEKASSFCFFYKRDQVLFSIPVVTHSSHSYTTLKNPGYSQLEVK